VAANLPRLLWIDRGRGAAAARDPLVATGRELTDPRADAGDHRHDARIRAAATLAQGGSTMFRPRRSMRRVPRPGSHRIGCNAVRRYLPVRPPRPRRIGSPGARPPGRPGDRGGAPAPPSDAKCCGQGKNPLDVCDHSDAKCT